MTNQNPEQIARDQIDKQLSACGLVIQGIKKNNLHVGIGVAVSDKTSLDITWTNDQSLADFDNLPDPETIAEEIVENLEAGLESFREIMVKLNSK